MQASDRGAVGMNVTGGVLAGNKIEMFRCGRFHGDKFPDGGILLFRLGASTLRSSKDCGGEATAASGGREKASGAGQ